MADSSNSTTDSSADQTPQRVVDGPHAPNDLAQPHSNQPSGTERRRSVSATQQNARQQRSSGRSVASVGNSHLSVDQASGGDGFSASVTTEPQQLAEIGRELLEIQAVCDLIRRHGVTPQKMRAYFLDGLIAAEEPVAEESTDVSSAGHEVWLDSLSIDGDGLVHYRDAQAKPASQVSSAERFATQQRIPQSSGHEFTSLSWSQHLERMGREETTAATTKASEKPGVTADVDSAIRSPDDLLDEEQLLATESRRTDLATMFSDAIQERFADSTRERGSNEQSRQRRGVFYALARKAWMRYGILLPKIRPQDWIVIGAIGILLVAGIMAVGPIRWIRGAGRVPAPATRGLELNQRQRQPGEVAPNQGLSASDATTSTTGTPPAKGKEEQAESATQVHIDQVTKMIDEMELHLKGVSGRSASENSPANSSPDSEEQHSRLSIMDTTLRHETPIDLHRLLAQEKASVNRAGNPIVISSPSCALPVQYSDPLQTVLSGIALPGKQPLAIQWPDGETSSLLPASAATLVFRDGSQDVFRLTTQDGQSVARLTDDGRQSSVINRLVQARLTYTGEHFYLRPKQTASPLLLSLARTQSEQRWPLHWPVDQQRCALSVRLASTDSRLSDKLQISWLQPFNSSRCEGTAIGMVHTLQPDAPALALKLEFSTDQQLRCRVSYFARFAPNEPWWSFSQLTFAKSRLDFDQLKQQMVKQLAEAAPTSNERGQLVSFATKRQLAQRVAKAKAREQQIQALEQLAASVHEKLQLDLELGVRWGDEIQPVLSTAR